ncbi:MAG: tRNA (adenosine(37)-N6)-threonylcarbamoyltransferase complex transferase subunit TsaD [Patescibacteria group bacterium]
MKILAIETSCDETAIALVDAKETRGKAEFTILANQLMSQIKLHAEYGGVFPMMAKREHSKNIVPILVSVLKKAKLYSVAKKVKNDEKLDKKIAKILEKEPELLEQYRSTLIHIKKPKVDAIAVTTGPGLEPALWVGINFAQALSALWNIPVISVNHMEGHIFSIFPNKMKTFVIDKKKTIFPMLSLLVSGGHTEIILIKDWMKYKLLGQTRDDAAGEAFDKVARMLGLPYPGGPEISRLAKEEREKGNESKITLPRPMLHSKDYDFSFSGLKTAVLYYIRDNGPITEKKKSEIAKEFEDAATDVLSAKTIRAVQEYKVKTLIVGGGVSANTHLQEMLREELKKNSLATKIHFPVKNLSTDNALMIAIAGFFRFKKKNSRRLRIKADGNLKL